MPKAKLPCLTCIHCPVCEKKNIYENYFEKTLGEACDRIPDFLIVKIECKFYKSEDSFVPMIRHNV